MSDVNFLMLFLCRFKQKCEALQKEQEIKLAVERAKTKKLGLLMTNLQEDLLTAVCYYLLFFSQ